MKRVYDGDSTRVYSTQAGECISCGSVGTPCNQYRLYDADGVWDREVSYTLCLTCDGDDRRLLLYRTQKK